MPPSYHYPEMLSTIAPNARVVVVVVGQPGCGACEEYLPKVQAIAPSYARVLPIVILSAADPRPEVQAWMDQYKIEATPTTLVLRRRELGGGVWKMEGLQDDAVIRQVMDFAYAQSVRG